MERIEYWGKSIATFILVVLIVQWSWNEIMPIFRIPELNILQALALVLIVVIPTVLISIAWRSSEKPVQHFHYNINSKGQLTRSDDNDAE